MTTALDKTYTDILCIIRRTTAKEFQIETGPSKLYWVPRSVCLNGHEEFQNGQTITLEILDRVCQEKKIYSGR